MKPERFFNTIDMLAFPDPVVEIEILKMQAFTLVLGRGPTRWGNSEPNKSQIRNKIFDFCSIPKS